MNDGEFLLEIIPFQRHNKFDIPESVSWQILRSLKFLNIRWQNSAFANVNEPGRS